MIARYNMTFPDGTSDASIELHCYRWGCNVPGGDRVDGTGLEQWEHLYKAIKILWPEKMADGKKGYIEHKWTIPRIKAWCEIKLGNDDVWWGPSSVGKTTDAAVLIVAHWLSAPDRTSVNVVSTKMDALKLRIFGEIARFYQMVDGLPGEYKASYPCIVLGGDNSKNGIFGHAIWKGNVDQAMNNLIGIHNEFNVFIIDEFQGTLPAAVSAIDNLSSGREFKFLGMGNPQSRLDPMGRHSEPKDGWDSINDKMDVWKTKRGTVHFWDGRQSPGVDEPGKYWFMLTQKLIDETVRIHGKNSPQFWSQRIGYIPPEGLLPTVMSESFIIQNKMQDQAIWQDGFRMAAGFDPAYSANGDRAVLYPFKYGMMSNGLFGIEYQEPLAIELGSVGEKLMSEHISEQVVNHCKSLGITPEDVAMDCTGTQGPLCDYLEKFWGRGILRVQFGGKPSGRALEHDSSQTSDKVYKNRVTELWYSMNYFGRHGHIRGLSDKSVAEFTQRQLSEIGTPMCVETKKLMKARTDESPDESDAAVIGLEWIRQKEMILPGTKGDNSEENEEETKAFREIDVDGDDQSYLSSPL